MKKMTVWALLLALTVAMLAGCTNTPAETTAPAPLRPRLPPRLSPAWLTLWHTSRPSTRTLPS